MNTPDEAGRGTPPSTEPRKPVEPSLSRRIGLRTAFLIVAFLALHLLWPSLLVVFSSWPRLLSLNPIWFAVMVSLEVGSFVCIWAIQRLVLQTRSWFGVATSQLAGNAISRLVPGGQAAGGTAQYRMLVLAGVEPTVVGTGLAAASLISAATLFALPVLSVPAALAGRPVPSGLARAGLLGGVVFMIAFAAGWVLLVTDRPLLLIGRALQWFLGHLHRRRPIADLPERLLADRNEVRDDLGEHWWEALLAALGNWLFDYLALLAALTAIGSRPRPTLVLLAYVASMVLGMIPITPGGLGFVEAGLTALLVVAGVSTGDAALAVLAYRLVSFWLPLPAGLVATWLHGRRYAAVPA